jgi:hypothetical protein
VNGLDKAVKSQIVPLDSFCQTFVLQGALLTVLDGVTEKSMVLLGMGAFVQKQQGAPTGNNVWANGGDGVRLLSTDPYLNPLERTNINLFVNYDVTDSIKARFEMYTNEMSAQEGATPAIYFK